MMVLRTGLTDMTAFVVVSMLLDFTCGACLSVLPSAVKDTFGLKNFGISHGNEHSSRENTGGRLPALVSWAGRTAGSEWNSWIRRRVKRSGWKWYLKGSSGKGVSVVTVFCVEGNKVVEVEYLELPWHDGMVVRQKCPGPGKVVDVCLNEADARLVCSRLTRGGSKCH